ncbi:adenylate/guanylate cyclase domain-containing protein [Actinocrispum sp. NPDC049592]|uniref:adenylate/guanylate cyclase domain-containing protein n=1 Tax=Actinocrispum sp. NPDC049592 TaxID=3154835 RepID=UPI0034417ADA
MEQRKLVTVLFCDLVGSTELAEVLEPETLRSVVMRYFDTARRQIEAHGGTVEKFIGDAVMAVFGVPVVHEDDARRGAEAALGMLSSLAGLNADLEDLFGCRLTVRIGVNTGEVVATSAQGANENLVAGDVVNVAARLQQNAEPGEILIGAATRALLDKAAEVEEAGVMALKGKRDPVPAFRLRGIRPDTPGAHPWPGSPFVGRAHELDLLSARWSSVLAGHGQWVTLSGEAGIGKTRLIEGWLSALPDDVLAGFGRCHPYRDQASLAPLAQALRQIVGTASRHGLVSDRLPYRALRSGLLLDGTPGRSVDGTYAAVAAVLADLSAARPVVLVLDDAQWADPMLLDGVGKLHESLRAARVLLVCAGRDCPFRTIELGPLSAQESALLAAELVELQPHGPSVLGRVIERAEGNPLYLEQLVAMLDDGADPERLPVTVTAVLAARIDALDPPGRLVLDAAAVVGRQFGLRDVAALAGTGGPAAVAELMRRGLVEPVGDQEYRFRSGLLRDAAYQGISKRRRADWHERLAEQSTGLAVTGHHLEQAYLHRHGLGMRDEHTGQLRGQAARTLAEAGRLALARADLSWSADLSSRALEHSTKDDSWWTAAAQVLGETLLATGAGGQLLREVLATAAEQGDDLTHAHARLQLAALDDQPAGPRWMHAARAAREVLPVFEANADELGLARAHIRLAQQQQILGSHRAAEQLLAQALKHAMAAKAAPEHAMTLGAIGMSLWHGPTPAEEAVRCCRELLAVHGGDHDVVIVTLTYPLANLLALQGLDEAAQECLAVAGRFAAELGYAEAEVVGPLFSGGVEALAGRLASAERLLGRAVELCRATGDPGLIATASRELARVLLRQGKRPGADLLVLAGGAPPAEAADHFGILARTDGDTNLARRAVALAESTDSPIIRATAQLDLATVSLAAGDGTAAAQAADRAAEVFRDKGHVVGTRAAVELRKAAR